MIAHVDADSFFASVLVRQNPALKGKPLLALGMGGSCVIAASYEAKAKGVKTGMRVKDALLLAPDALRIPSDYRETGLASQQIESVLRDVSPVIEQMSIDEWFLDLQAAVGGLPASLPTFAERIRKDVLTRVGLSVSVGIAPSKLLAKMASEYRKPGGVTVVVLNPPPPPAPPPALTPNPSPKGRGECFCLFPMSKNNYRTHTFPSPSGGRVRDEGGTTHNKQTHEELRVRAFLSDRPAAAIPGIGPRRQVHCEVEGWATAWDIAQAPPDKLKKLFGRPGLEMQRELLGERVFAVHEDTNPQQSISRARSFLAEGRTDVLWAHMLRHLEYIILKMRRMHQAAKGLSVWLRDASYAYKSTHCPLPRPLDTEEALQPFLRRCFHEIYERNMTYTQTGLALWKLCPGGKRQLSLFEDPRKVIGEESLQDSLDALHKRYGRNAITKGSALHVKSGTKKGLGMPIYESKKK